MDEAAIARLRTAYTELALETAGGLFGDVAKRLHKAFQKQGRVSPWDEAADPADAELTDSLQDAKPGLIACYQAAAAGIAVSGERAGRPLMRLMLGPGAMTNKSSSSEEPEQPLATALGVKLYAKQVVDGRDRAQLERLCRRDAAPTLPIATRVARRRWAVAHAQECLEGWPPCHLATHQTSPSYSASTDVSPSLPRAAPRPLRADGFAPGVSKSGLQGAPR